MALESVAKRIWRRRSSRLGSGQGLTNGFPLRENHLRIDSESISFETTWCVPAELVLAHVRSGGARRVSDTLTRFSRDKSK
jgi:hypothetical protein